MGTYCFDESSLKMLAELFPDLTLRDDYDAFRLLEELENEALS